ncbi:RNA pseudouridine synthase [bacterium]|jgi:23S rRNA pseudouridine1911/1915/1917 synthase|nr:RNA pseudouridine synthase [bacterium]
MSLTPSVEILIDDKPLLAINKPAGLLTQGPPPVERTLERLVKEERRRQQNKTGNVYLGIPHRLDRAVTGAIVFATNSKGAARLAEIFRDRRVQKTYWAILEQKPQPEAGELIDGLLKLDEVAFVEVVPLGTPGSKEAKLSYQTKQAVPGGWLVEIHPETGRFHQIRAQLGCRGWSVFGDLLYGAKQSLSADETGWIDDGSTSPVTPIALHSRQLVLPHPVRFDDITIQAPAPRYWHERGWVKE